MAASVATARLQRSLGKTLKLIETVIAFRRVSLQRRRPPSLVSLDSANPRLTRGAAAAGPGGAAGGIIMCQSDASQHRGEAVILKYVSLSVPSALSPRGSSVRVRETRSTRSRLRAATERFRPSGRRVRGGRGGVTVHRGDVKSRLC